MCPCYEQGGRDVSPRFIQITRVNLYLPTLSQMESVGLGNRTHQIPRFQGFLPAKPWATQGNSWASFAQTMGWFRQSIGINCLNHRQVLPIDDKATNLRITTNRRFGRGWRGYLPCYRDWLSRGSWCSRNERQPAWGRPMI